MVAKATGNRYFVDVLRDLGSTIIPRARHLANVEPESYNERMCREHGDIFSAIERQDSEAARAGMRMHLSNSRERLRRAQEALERDLASE
jgi:DNA-binding FadR family transcriptional regulator